MASQSWGVLVSGGYNQVGPASGHSKDVGVSLVFAVL